MWKQKSNEVHEEMETETETKTQAPGTKAHTLAQRYYRIEYLKGRVLRKSSAGSAADFASKGEVGGVGFEPGQYPDAPLNHLAKGRLLSN
jgi:hypothetical protein